MNRVFRTVQLSRCYNGISVRKLGTSPEESILQAGRKSLVYCEKDGHILKSPYESLKIPETTVDRQIWNNLSKWENHVAIECASTGRKLTYANLRDQSAALAVRLRKHLRLEKGDMVAVCLPNVPGIQNDNVELIKRHLSQFSNISMTFLRFSCCIFGIN